MTREDIVGKIQELLESDEHKQETKLVYGIPVDQLDSVVEDYSFLIQPGEMGWVKSYQVNPIEKVKILDIVKSKNCVTPFYKIEYIIDYPTRHGEDRYFIYSEVYRTPEEVADAILKSTYKLYPEDKSNV